MLKTLPSTLYPLPSRRGQTVLSLVFVIGAIIVLAAITLAFLAISFINSTYGLQIAERAKAAAASGVYDALMRLDRDKDLSSVGYSVSVGNDSATVSVSQDSPSAGLVTIISISTIYSRQKRMRVVVSRDSTSSLTSAVSWDQT